MRRSLAKDRVLVRWIRSSRRADCVPRARLAILWRLAMVGSAMPPILPQAPRINKRCRMPSPPPSGMTLASVTRAGSHDAGVPLARR